MFTHQAVRHLQGRREDHLYQELLGRPLVLKNTNETLVEFMYTTNQNTLKKQQKQLFYGEILLV